ncbi:hypothetical protein HPG69_012230 [Diceros bicornis minor]|uniref:Iodothyronine deiodinase n=1 Tax=Diceros bicornis minor TaxID=77932 RepID=A0A7J7F565_DICBM|nr:hypothetical protein HPG69_012230 [Diceros bicornis minor]
MGLPRAGLWLRRLWVLLQVALQVAVGKVLLIFFPERVKKHIVAMNQKNPHFSYDNWAPTLYSTQYFRFILKVHWQRLEDTTKRGGLAPNSPVVHLSGQRCNIWDFMQGNRPLRLIEDFTSIADFLIIYIEEAHASGKEGCPASISSGPLPSLPSPPSPSQDGWAFKNNVVIRNHRNLQDRLRAARLLLDRSPQCPVVVDTMKNQSSQLYAALPERLYVLREGRILYKVVNLALGTTIQRKSVLFWKSSTVNLERSPSSSKQLSAGECRPQPSIRGNCYNQNMKQQVSRLLKNAQLHAAPTVGTTFTAGRLSKPSSFQQIIEAELRSFQNDKIDLRHFSSILFNGHFLLLP